MESFLSTLSSKLDTLNNKAHNRKIVFLDLNCHEDTVLKQLLHQKNITFEEEILLKAPPASNLSMTSFRKTKNLVLQKYFEHQSALDKTRNFYLISGTISYHPGTLQKLIPKARADIKQSSQIYLNHQITGDPGFFHEDLFSGLMWRKFHMNPDFNFVTNSFQANQKITSEYFESNCLVTTQKLPSQQQNLMSQNHSTNLELSRRIFIGRLSPILLTGSTVFSPNLYANDLVKQIRNLAQRILSKRKIADFADGIK